MLGSAADAEEIVQEVWIRWQEYDRDSVDNPAAFLATITTRLAINLSQSAHSTREAYIGPWLPEPIDTSADPAMGAERGEALELAVLVLLERLTPTEFRFLASLAAEPGVVVRRRAAVAAAWPDGAMVSENTIDSYVRRLRVKLAAIDSPRALETIRGVGFVLR